MKRIVINSCYGGFSVSPEALYWLLQLGFPLRKITVEESYYKEQDFILEGPDGVRAIPHGRVLLKDGCIYSFDSDMSDDADALRSHPALVKVVELLGKRANGSCADLVIEDYPDSMLYRIDEYDGLESVVLLSSSDYTAGFDYVDVPLPPGMQIDGPSPLLLK